MTHPGEPSAPPALFERLEAEDRRRSVVETIGPAIAIFLTVSSYIAVVEWITRPGHRLALVTVGTLYAAISAACLGAIRRWPQHAVAIAVTTISSLSAAMLAYSPMVQGGGELCVLSISVLLGGFAVAFPLGLRNQLLASIVPLVGYAVVLQLGTRTAYPAWYSASGLVCFLVVLAIAARTGDRNRARILRESQRQRILAAENARLRDEARAADRAKTDLLSILSHELRTPLNNIRLVSEMLADGAYSGPAEMDEFLRMIRNQSQRANDMVHTMLEFGSIESGEIPTRAEPFDLGEMLRQLRDSIPDAWCAPGVEIAWAWPSEPVAMRTDRSKLEAIVSNLLHNAAKHTSRGTILVEATFDAARDRIRFSVDDTGDGIPRDAVPHIFDRYARGRTDESRGFGLGLYIVKRFAEELRGSVHVESVPGAGTRFEVQVPRRLGASGDRAAA